MKNIILTGFMGTGKSSVGKIFAAHLGYWFIDLDMLIVAEMRMTISEIFDHFGEFVFAPSKLRL